MHAAVHVHVPHGHGGHWPVTWFTGTGAVPACSTADGLFARS